MYGCTHTRETSMAGDGLAGTKGGKKRSNRKKKDKDKDKYSSGGPT